MSRARDTADQINRVNSSAADATAITVDSSENVLIGQTTASSGTVGTSLRPDGRNFYCADGNYSAHFNRNSSDGAIAHFAKDDTLVGSIFSGHGGTQVGIGTNTTGITFNPSTRSMMPANPSSTNPQLDATLDIGFPSVRWKDLYLSGGVYLGGTGSANKLEDYEEGTWTPTHTGGSGTGSFSDARYTKIGNTVQVYFTFSFSGGGGSMAISGFPFNANGNSVGIGREDQTNGYGVYGRINSGNSSVYLYATQAASNASAYQVSNGAIKFAITYETNS